MSFTGRCACGKVTLAIKADAPIQTRQCWCRQCQQIATGGPTHNAIFRTEDVMVTGELAAHSYIAASGNTLKLSFCPSCGSHVHGASSARPQFRTIRLGALDEPHGLRPQMAIWLDDAPAWAWVDPKLEQYPRQPPPPTLPAE